MNPIESEALAVAEQVAPQLPIVQAIEAIAATVADPSVANIVADLAIANKLMLEFKNEMDKLNPLVASFFRALF